MSSFVESHHFVEHAGLLRVQRAVQFLQEAWVTLLGRQGLAALLRRATVKARAGRRAWHSSRRQAAEDERIWNAALKDARMLAELSRAMQGQGR